MFIPCSCRATSLVQFWHHAFITHLCSVTLYNLLSCNIHLLQPPCRNHRQPNEDVRRPVQERPSPALFNKPPQHKRRPPGHEAFALLLLESCPPRRVLPQRQGSTRSPDMPSAAQLLSLEQDVNKKHLPSRSDSLEAHIASLFALPTIAEPFCTNLVGTILCFLRTVFYVYICMCVCACVRACVCVCDIYMYNQCKLLISQSV